MCDMNGDFATGTYCRHISVAYAVNVKVALRSRVKVHGMNGNVAGAALMLAGLHLTCPHLAAASESSSPDNISPATSQADQLQQPPSLAADEDGFLSLLEKNTVSGGPPKDGIPAIEEPRYTSAADADEWLLADDVVFGVAYNGFIAAYPQRIMVWHEIANESVEGQRLSITYCPLTGTAIGFKGSLTPQTPTTFGVSGDLVNSNLIMYDRATESRWPQILGKAITGPLRAARLEEFRVVWTRWEQWKQKYPATRVLSRDTGFIRNYGRNADPYGSYLRDDKGYYASEQLLFRPIVEDQQLKAKEVVVGIRDQAGSALAVTKDRLRQEKGMEVRLGNRRVDIAYDPELDYHSASYNDTGEWINAFDAMWFAWKAFYPHTELLR